jgi:alpha-tubulin suppressor-like RCC1 family protein
MGPAALHGVVITKQGTAFSFGRNESGQLGLGDEKTRTYPRMIQNLGDKIIDAACGARHTLLLGASGKVYSCGKNTSGQLGASPAHSTRYTARTVNLHKPGNTLFSASLSFL